MMQAQEALLQVHWEPDVLQLHHCCPVLSQDRLLFVGPRVRMGMYEGTPVRIQPHTSSGRADYFGVLVNRCASFPSCLNAVLWAPETSIQWCRHMVCLPLMQVQCKSGMDVSMPGWPSRVSCLIIYFPSLCCPPFLTEPIGFAHWQNQLLCPDYSTLSSHGHVSHTIGPAACPAL